jgi:hypothetical protein
MFDTNSSNVGALEAQLTQRQLAKLLGRSTGACAAASAIRAMQQTRAL